MTQSPIGSGVRESPDIHIYLAAQTPFHLVVGLYNSAQLSHLLFGQCMSTGLGIYPCLCYNFAGRTLTDPIDIGESDCDPLIPGQIYTCNTCQLGSPSFILVAVYALGFAYKSREQPHGAE